MDGRDRIRTADELMRAFVSRTGVSASGRTGTRYLWTDAFAVFNLLALRDLTDQERYLGWARQLVDQVHQVLGRHRDDDGRTGWISGLSATEGRRHPTSGGLRIGKRLRERRPEEPHDERLEWDRDGQYFHYLTKWMHALDRMGLVTGETVYNDWARELARTAYRAFVQESPGGGRGICWKMSIDLSRPLVAATGQMDALDGLVTFSRLEAAAPTPHLAELGRMCEGRTWSTGDPLGIGGLLAEAGEIIQLTTSGAMNHPALLDDVLRDVHHGLRILASQHDPSHPAETRLAFRELGLAIGLQALPAMRDDVVRCPDRFPRNEALLTRIDAARRFTPLIERIQRFWLDPTNRRARSWTEHLDINAVMLATSLVPHVYLCGGRAGVADDGSSPPVPRPAVEHQ
jgi:hypothetical protein